MTSLVYHFGQQAVPLQLFAPVLKLPLSKLVSFSDVLPEYVQELFVYLPGSSIRPAHELIAEEMPGQLLSRGHGDRRNWKLGLADATVEFLSLASQQYRHSQGAISDLVRAVIIERGLEETAAGPWEGRFSRLISEIPSSEGAQRVFETLTNLFPEESHFWAHL